MDPAQLRESANRPRETVEPGFATLPCGLGAPREQSELVPRSECVFLEGTLFTSEWGSRKGSSCHFQGFVW